MCQKMTISAGFSILESIAQRQIDERVSSDRKIVEGSRISSADEFLGEDDLTQEWDRYYPSQSANSLMRIYFEINPPTYLGANHPTTIFSADQVIEFARAIGLELSIALYTMDLLKKARVGNVSQPVTSRYPAGRSLLPSVSGSTMGDSVASPLVYSLPTITETESSNVVGTVPIDKLTLDWLVKELKNMHVDNYIEFIDDLRFAYLDELHTGPQIGHLVTFLSSSPKLAK